MQNLESLLRRVPVIPVLVIEDLAHAVPLAGALCRGGLDVLEITLRTPVALDAVRAIRDALPNALVGAGTVLTPDDLSAAVSAGARFLVSPGSTPALLDAAEGEAGAALLPGAATASEVMALLERGYRCQKFFPAEAAGGVALLKALNGPLPGAIFCPTGGIDAARAKDYLALPNVACVGGSWLAPAADVTAGHWDAIEQRARAASRLQTIRERP